MTVVVDFCLDWKNHLAREIATLGYVVGGHEDARSLSYKFFNLQRRRISARPRTVHEAASFTCPANLTVGYTLLKNKLSIGVDVCPYLSKFLLRDDYEDSLLNDWGIHHFHLGEHPEKSGFVERTGPLLFAHVVDDAIYCLGIYPHRSWSRQVLIRVLHDNWPHVLSGRRLQGVLGVAHTPTDDQIGELREAGINTLIQVEPGIVYAPLGGGYSTAGTSIASTMRVVTYMRLIQSMEDHVRNDPDNFARKIRELGYSPGDPMTFTLSVNEVGVYAIEDTSRVAFLFHRHSND